MAESGYCVKCKGKKNMKDEQKVTMKNGRAAMKGKCPDCGTGMYRSWEKNSSSGKNVGTAYYAVPTKEITIEAKKLALRVASIAASKKALKRLILDMRGISDLCDYFFIASGNSHRQVNAIAQAIITEVEKDGIKPLSKLASGDESGWVVVDLGAVIAHIFYKPMREFYSLERLWSEAKPVRPPRKIKIS